MTQELSRVRKIAYAAMLLALYVVANRLIGLAQPGPVFSFNRLGIGVALIMFASLILGPVYGAVVGVAGDAIGWVILGQWTGAFNVFLSVFYLVLGLLPYFLKKGFGERVKSEHSLLAFLITYSLLFLAFLACFWTIPGFDAVFSRWSLDPFWGRVFLSVLCSVLFVGTLVAITVMHRFPRAGVSVGEVAWYCLIIEIVVIFLKPLAFYLYCLVFLGANIEEAWHISYGTLVLLSFLFSFADMLINILFLRLVLWIWGGTRKGRQNEAR